MQEFQVHADAARPCRNAIPIQRCTVRGWQRASHCMLKHWHTSVHACRNIGSNSMQNGSKHAHILATAVRMHGSAVPLTKALSRASHKPSTCTSSSSSNQERLLLLLLLLVALSLSAAAKAASRLSRAAAVVMRSVTGSWNRTVPVDSCLSTLWKWDAPQHC